ncbi:endopeptidase La [Parasporobacterium paucivorans]|uniref:Lon protease n=1 Tax=Parasporobacterium paucivorans DSM 15970 TaxID=1122934 RepID=A0A1M6KE07_9FIRM|nr:endopeptidase La [Parasporobacterium paucivorans]SHJ57191.1 ATP-dependent Lon protease [Parasporobacterium paucivorans DSM 15970]
MTDRQILPVIPLRGMTVLPGMITHFDVSREKSVRAIEQVMVGDRLVFLLTQKDAGELEINPDNMYSVGVVAQVKQLIQLPSNIVRVLIEAKDRAKLIEWKETEPILKAEIEHFELESAQMDEASKEAMVRTLQEMVERFLELNPQLKSDAYKYLGEMTKLDEVLEQLAIHASLPYTEKQVYLEAENMSAQYEILAKYLGNEIEVSRIKRELQDKVKEKIDTNQKEYILREQMKLIREELGDDETFSEADTFMEELKKLKAPKSVKEKIEKEIKRFKSSGANSAESSMTRGYIEVLLNLPWDKASKDNRDIKHAKAVLDEEHYGLEQVKERILEFLAVRALKANKGPSPILCLVGPPGTGKSSIAKSVASALGKKYVRISLGGVRDEAEIRGHRKTYVGAMPGRIANALKQAGVKNPLMLLDEIDKLGNDYKGDPSAALLEVLDTEQNTAFRDHYVELPIDLSEVLFIVTANTTQTIPGPLLDRMEIIEVTSYTQNEKEHIAKDYLLPKQIRRHGLDEAQLKISIKALKMVIADYTREAGVRNLERKLADICRKAAKEILETGKKTVNVTEKSIEKYLGKPLYSIEYANEADEIGIVRGLAWTSVGGDTLQIEVNIMPGKGEIMLTGKLGEVMKESAMTGLSYIRSIAPKYNIPDEFFKNNDIHIHIPEGATPKDGPSAGISMATAMLSAILKRPVKSSVAMTGEITLRGRVIPIGGLKEKILAAKVAGIKTVLIPAKNKRDVDDISMEIRKGLNLIFVENMEAVLKEALN